MSDAQCCPVGRRIQALTASCSDEERARCADAGMAEMMPKPIKLDTLQARQLFVSTCVDLRYACSPGRWLLEQPGSADASKRGMHPRSQALVHRYARRAPAVAGEEPGPERADK